MTWGLPQGAASWRQHESLIGSDASSALGLDADKEVGKAKTLATPLLGMAHLVSESFAHLRSSWLKGHLLTRSGPGIRLEDYLASA
ncbi:MAG: hypothetical protein KDK66_05690, partial [Deltaproteobacteria bacterium]|nr:hypothetical protein [Deltaproteobacteria bacterium]